MLSTSIKLLLFIGYSFSIEFEGLKGEGCLSPQVLTLIETDLHVHTYYVINYSSNL